MKRAKSKIVAVPVNLIDVSDEVDRMEVDEEKVVELAASIGEVGLLQAILVRPVGERFEIVAGRRRWMACKSLEISFMDAVVREMSDAEAAIVRATENLARENLTPLEEARIFGNLVAKYGMGQDEIGKKFGFRAGTVRRRMDILKMPPVLQEAVHSRKINVSVAEELWPISDEGDLNYYLMFALESGCTRDTARKWCKDWKDSKRRDRSAGEEGVQVFAANEPRPVYVACDLCVGPMEVGKETLLRLCGDCYKTIKQNM